MKVLSSPSRIRLAALAVTIVGLTAFAAAEGSSGRPAIVLASASLALFIVEIVLGILEARAPPHEE